MSQEGHTGHTYVVRPVYVAIYMAQFPSIEQLSQT